MSQSATRRKGTEILRDEINAIIGVVRSHSENLTRRLERVRDLTVKYCAEKPRGSSLSLAAAAPAAAPPPLESMGGAAASAVPAPTVFGQLNTIPEVNESAEAETLSLPVARSRGPVSWDTFRSKVGEGTNLKTGKTNTLKQISTLWTQVKNGKSVGDIEKYLRNELKIEPTVAAQKAPELERIARNHLARTTKKSNAASASAAAAPVKSRRVSRSRLANGTLGTVQAKKPINPNDETDEEFWARMNEAAVTNNKRKTEAALAIPEQRKATAALAATRLPQTPLKNRTVPMAGQIPTLVPTMGKNPVVVNPTTGEEEELSL
jgi:hypothetical protein